MLVILFGSKCMYHSKIMLLLSLDVSNIIFFTNTTLSFMIWDFFYFLLFLLLHSSCLVFYYYHNLYFGSIEIQCVNPIISIMSKWKLFFSIFLKDIYCWNIPLSPLFNFFIYYLNFEFLWTCILTSILS